MLQVNSIVSMQSNQTSSNDQPDQVGFLTDEAKKFLAVAILFLMDLDIQSKVNSEAKVSLRNEYAKSIETFAIPVQYKKLSMNIARMNMSCSTF